VVLSTQGKSTIVAVILAIALFKVLSETSFETPIRWYGTLDFSHNVGQFIPYSVFHPLSALKDNDIRDFERRLTAAEYDIAHLKVRTNLDSEAISQLEKALPDTIVCKQDGLGKLQIPDNFWHALQDKIRSDNALLERQFTEKETKAIASTSLSKKEVISIAQKQAEQVLHKSNTKNWEKFLNDNRALIVSWTGDEFDKQTDSLRRDVLTSKSEFLELIEQNWADTKDEIQKELSPQMKTLDLIRNRVTQLEKKVTGATKDEIRAIAVDVSKNLISGAQLGSLANANLKVNVKHGLRRLNHFSPGTGAVINPKLTSSNFVFPSMRHNMLSKLLRSLVYRPIPVPNPPEFALSRWEEHGECWCSPLNSNEGLWPTLGVIVSNDIYPDQVVVEHIPMTASLEPGSAPKEMELWVYIEDPVTRAAIESRTMDFFHTEKDPRNLVQIGSWTYDTESMQDIQSFPLQIDLKMFEGRSYTNNLVVRVTSNWGGDRVNYACLYRVRVNGKVAEQKA
jgi:Sad1 / UNC-like C-terminal